MIQDLFCPTRTRLTVCRHWQLRDEIERLTEGRLATPRDHLEMFERIKASTRSKMQKEQQLHAKVVRLNVPKRPHTARDTTASSLNKTGGHGHPLLAQLGKNMLCLMRDEVPLPADGSRPRPSTGSNRVAITPHSHPKPDERYCVFWPFFSTVTHYYFSTVTPS